MHSAAAANEKPNAFREKARVRARAFRYSSYTLAFSLSLSSKAANVRCIRARARANHPRRTSRRARARRQQRLSLFLSGSAIETRIPLYTSPRNYTGDCTLARVSSPFAVCVCMFAESAARSRTPHVRVKL